MSLLLCAIGLSLCVNGHPCPRSHDITYGGLLPRPGFQRDHIIPLCLGGPDRSYNLQYQPLEQAHLKDRDEWAYCEAYCRGKISLQDARQFFKEWK